MAVDSRPLQYLLSLPPAMAQSFSSLEKRCPPAWVAASDPPNSKLGSGGGIAHLLVSSWKETGEGADFSTWLKRSAKLLLMAGGQSRRLPAYAAPGKILLPFKALRGISGQRLDQTLLDVQLPAYERIMDASPDCLRVLVTSGDVLLRFGYPLPPLPEADIVCFGMWVPPETASRHGVFFSRRETPTNIAFFRQKPTPEEITAQSVNYAYLVDTGMWLLSEKAVNILLKRCGWQGEQFPNNTPGFYEIYADMGLGLGSEPTVPDADLGSLRSAVIPLPNAEFYHLGTSRELIASASVLENGNTNGLGGWNGRQPHPDQHVLNSVFSLPLRHQDNHTLWIENSVIPKTWEIASEHVLTGIPCNNWNLKLERGRCLDFVPIDEESFAVRPYHIDDQFKGAVGLPSTRWLGNSVVEWLTRRKLTLHDAEFNPETDIQQAALFPVIPNEELNSDLIQWLLDDNPADSLQNRLTWLRSDRISAEEICNRGNLQRLYRQRQANLAKVLGPFIRNNRCNSFFKLDLKATVESFSSLLGELPEFTELEPLDRIHERSFRSAVLRKQGNPAAVETERQAFEAMRELIVDEDRLPLTNPERTLLDDQIIWARSPVRLDLAGGWSDTPPYCLEYGGSVLNMAVDLNGQPPVQVFCKLSDTPEIVIRSIDLGVEKRLLTYEDIDDFQQPDNFSLARAALALSGFLPRFCSGSFRSLRDQLTAFGGGIELTLLSAVPKGSGLGTSSILSATVLGALGELCGLGWDKQALFQRTLALEQLLTTGGGWQDQAGGLHHGVKLVETSPGLDQKPSIRWLSDRLLEEGIRSGVVLLYYTGITRLAKSILQDIVRGLFLNSRQHLDIVNEIRAHAIDSFQALQCGNWNALTACVDRSWRLNQQLDSGTNPPSVQVILDQVEEYCAAAKLLGAGGGGYLLLIAKDEASARLLKDRLLRQPPNATARFVDLSISQNGLVVTRS